MKKLGILIKLNNELRWEIRDFIGKKTPRQIHEIKNISIWINIRGKIKKWNLGRKIDREEWELDKITKK